MNEPIMPRAASIDDDDRLVTVCASCLCASCWLGEFGCDNYRAADCQQFTVSELRKLDREDPSYWAEERKHG